MKYGNFVLIWTLITAACSGGDQNFKVGEYGLVVAKGDRQLGIDVSSIPENGNLGESLAYVKSIGANIVPLSLDWNTIETSPGTFNDPGGIFALLNTALPIRQLKLSLSLNALNRGINKVPIDLSAALFSDLAVSNRYGNLLNYVVSRLPNVEIVYLGAATDVDLYLAAPGFPGQFALFTERIKTIVHGLRPSILVGVSADFSGLTGSQQGFMAQINATTDVVAFNYYAINSDFSIRFPATPGTEIPLLMELYPDRSFVLLETGFPSSVSNGSDEQKQMLFFRELFRVWDSYADRWPLLIAGRLNDFSRVQAEQIAAAPPYSTNNEQFIEFLRSSGLRTYAQKGLDKTAFLSLKDEAKRRGF